MKKLRRRTAAQAMLCNCALLMMLVIPETVLGGEGVVVIDLSLGVPNPAGRDDCEPPDDNPDDVGPPGGVDGRIFPLDWICPSGPCENSPVPLPGDDPTDYPGVIGRMREVSSGVFGASGAAWIDSLMLSGLGATFRAISLDAASSRSSSLIRNDQLALVCFYDADGQLPRGRVRLTLEDGLYFVRLRSDNKLVRLGSTYVFRPTEYQYTALYEPIFIRRVLNEASTLDAARFASADEGLRAERGDCPCPECPPCEGDCPCDGNTGECCDNCCEDAECCEQSDCCPGDPCCPDPCVCITCNDDDPCTDDSCVNGSCQFVHTCDPEDPCMRCSQDGNGNCEPEEVRCHEIDNPGCQECIVCIEGVGCRTDRSLCNDEDCCTRDICNDGCCENEEPSEENFKPTIEGGLCVRLNNDDDGGPVGEDRNSPGIDGPNDLNDFGSITIGTRGWRDECSSQKITLSRTGPGLIRLYFGAGTSVPLIWGENDGSLELPDDLVALVPAASGAPAWTFKVEGAGAGHVTLTAEYSCGGTSHESDPFELDVIGVDLDVDSNNDGSITDDEDRIEFVNEEPHKFGKIICSETNAAQPRTYAALRIVAQGPPGSEVSFTFPSQLKVFTTQGGSAVGSPFSLPIPSSGTLNQSLWVLGTPTAGRGEITARISGGTSGGCADDTVAITTFAIANVCFEDTQLCPDGQSSTVASAVVAPATMQSLGSGGELITWDWRPGAPPAGQTACSGDWSAAWCGLTPLAPTTQCHFFAGNVAGLVFVRASLAGDPNCWFDVPYVFGCGCSSCTFGSGSNTVGSIDFKLPLGVLEGGKSAGTLYLHSEGPSPWLGSPHALRYNRASTDGLTDTIRDEDDRLRQIRVGSRLVDIVVDPASNDRQYTISFYPTCSATPGPGGLYTTTDPAIVSWEVESIDHAIPYSELVIRKIEAAAEVMAYRYVYTEPASGETKWVLSTEELGVAGRRESVQWANTSPPTRLVLVEEFRSGSWITLSEVEETWDAARERVVARTVMPGAANEMSTSFGYSAEGQITATDDEHGSWQLREFDANGRLWRVASGWKNAARPASIAAMTDGTKIEYDYTGEAGQHPASAATDVRPRVVREWINGVLVSKTYHDYYTEAGTNLEVEVEERCPSVSNAFGAATNLRTVTKYFDAEREDTASVTYPSGRRDVYSYQNGDYNGATTPPTFSVNPNGSYRRIRVSHESPTGVVDGHSRLDERIEDAFERTMFDATYAAVGTAYATAPMEWSARVYDSQGRLTDTIRSNGESEHVSYSGCCGDEIVTDVFGRDTITETDALGRTQSVTRASVGSYSSSYGVLPAHPAEITTYSYVSESGNPATTMSRTGGTNTLTATSVVDAAGRTLLERDEAGLETTYAYENIAGGGRRVTKTNPDGGTEITEYFRDGRMKSVTGTAVVAQYADYGVISSSGWTWTRSDVGSADSPRFSKTYSDALGRTVREERPAFDYTTTPQSLVTKYEYVEAGSSPTPGAGAVRKTVLTVGVDLTQIRAPMLYVYDEMDNVSLSGMDINGDDQLTLAGVDRVQSSTTRDVFTSNAWWTESTSSTYQTFNDATPTTTTSLQRRSGFATNVRSESWTIDSRDNASITRVLRDAGDPATFIQERTTSGATGADITVSRLGRTELTISRTGETLTYEYDDLSRTTRVNGPRAGQYSITNFEPGTNRVETVVNATPSASDAVTTYEYYEQAGSNMLGRLRSVTDDAGKKSYFAYNLRGQTEYVWGDVPQPVRMVYDTVYGQRTELHTYRDPSGAVAWTSPTLNTAWPTSGSDKTSWVYDAATGRVVEKHDAASLPPNNPRAVTYEYTVDGRLAQRTWTRGIVSNYSYDPNTHELIAIDYADTPSITPDVTQTWTRLGQLDVVTDNRTGYVHDFGYSPEGESTTETVTGVLASPYTLTRTFSPTAPGRLDRVQLTGGYDAKYFYDAATGRMNRVTGPGLPSGTTNEFGARYAYLPGSNLVDTIALRDDTTRRLLIDRDHEAERGQVTLLTHTWQPDASPPTRKTISAYGYATDDIGRRQHVANPASEAFAAAAFTTYAYSNRNELTYADRYLGTDPQNPGPPVDEERFSYEYDAIGNRRWSKVGVDKPAKLDYTGNWLNQYIQTLADGALLRFNQSYDSDGNLTGEFLAADCDCSGSIGPSDIGAFVLALTSPEDYETTYPNCELATADLNGDGQASVGDLQLFQIVLLECGGGDCLSPSRIYEWDHENRLIGVRPAQGKEGAKKVVYDHDFQGRRVRRTVYDWVVSTGSWSTTPNEDTRYVYDGWLLLEEREGPGSSPLLRRYTWGLDLGGLSGSVNDRTSAGGIGGLLALDELDPDTTSHAGGYAYLCDLMGNVGQLVDIDDGAIAAKYEYDPYGNRVNAAAGVELAQPFQFSSKRFDPLTELVYYGYRDLLPRWGRWISRDPLFEREVVDRFAWRGSGADPGQLYAFAQNGSIHKIDPIGLCVCGPDITQELHRIVADLRRKYRALTVPMRFGMCNSLVSAGGWDIYELHKHGQVGGDATLNRPGCGTGCCAGTVQVHGSCYLAAEVNYMLWGAANRLCYESRGVDWDDKFSPEYRRAIAYDLNTGAILGDRLSSWTLLEAQAWTSSWRAAIDTLDGLTLGLLLDQPNSCGRGSAYCRNRWTEAGWENYIGFGSLTGPGPNRGCSVSGCKPACSSGITGTLSGGVGTGTFFVDIGSR